MRKPASLRDRAAQLLMPRLGSNMPPAVSVEADEARATELLKRVPVGGFVLFRGSWTRSPAVLDRLQQASETPLLISSDLERGAGQQLAGATVFPHSMAFGHVGAAQESVRKAAEVTAQEALAAGVHWIFGPVADVHSNPVNPIISTRSFGREPHQCGQLAASFIQGCADGGALSTAKHFPGHGDTDTDSHDALPAVSKSLQELEAVELAPFRAAIAAGVDALMTAHVAYPALDASGLPATYSPAILRDLLREEMGFQGVVVSDSLLMGAAGRSVSERAPEIVAAGVDVLLDISHPEVALDAMLAAVAEGRLEERLIQEAFDRVWAMKSRVLGDGLRAESRAVRTLENQQLAARVAREAIQVEGRSLTSVLGAQPSIPLVVVRPHTDYPDPTRAETADILSAASQNFTLSEVGPDTTQEELFLVSRAAADVGRCVVALVVKPAAWHAFGLLPFQHEFVGSLINNSETVLVILGSPDADHRLPEPAVRVLSFSDVEASVRAVADLLTESL